MKFELPNRVNGVIHLADRIIKIKSENGKLYVKKFGIVNKLFY